jgi:long-subunit fatty acid transport protein
MRKIRLIISGIIMLIANITYAESKGIAGAQFLKIGVGARPVAMGEAFCAVADDVSSIHWNPAGLVYLKNKELLAMHTDWFEEMNYEYLAFGLIMNEKAVGIGLCYSDSGKILGYDINSRPTGDFSAYDTAINLVYASKLSNTVSYGFGFKGIYQKIEKEDATSIGLDLGMLYRKENLSYGFVLQNIGPEIKFIEKGDRFPFNCKLGVAYIHEPFTLSLDLNKSIDNDLKVNLGGEFWIKRILALRLGYNSQINKDEDEGLTAGAGFKIGSYQFDYAYVPYGDLDSTHRVSLIVRF